MKIPPFGKPLMQLLAQGFLPNNNVYLFIGKLSWEKGKNSSYCRPSRTLILPPNDLPFSYEWPVYGCDILMIETSRLSNEYIEDITSVLFDFGAIKITLISTENLLTVYKKDF
jgi:hypothetical protein